MQLLIEKIEQYAVYLGLAMIFLYVAPYFILGQNSHVLIHDNLDANVTWLKLVGQSGKIFSSNLEPIDQIMNGLPRISLGSEFFILVWLNYWFSPFTAYVINQVVMHVVAFMGMYFLLKKHVLYNESQIVIVGTAVCFALLPFWPSGSLSIAGLPLALYAFMNIKENQAKGWDWLIVVTIPFFSSFALSFCFFLSIMVLVWLYHSVIHKRVNWKFAFAIILMTTIFLCIEYRLVSAMFLQDGFISHRVEMLSGNKGTKEVIQMVKDNFMIGQYHVATFHKKFVLPAIIIALILGYRDKRSWRLLAILLFSALTISIFYGLWHWEGLSALKEKSVLLRSFNFSRFHWLHPLIWYLAFGIALSMLYNRRWGKFFVLVILVGQISFSFYNSDELAQRRTNNITYKEFYSEALFHDISQYIGEEQKKYRVVSIGIHPSIAQYNGFYTLDGYIAYYPLEYKHKFRKIIEGELQKSDNLRRNYDEWGSRFYVFSSELEKKGFLVRKKHNAKINKLDFNSQAFAEMGGKYVFSAAEIINANETGLVLEKEFQRVNSPWHIYLYKVKEK